MDNHGETAGGCVYLAAAHQFNQTSFITMKALRLIIIISFSLCSCLGRNQDPECKKCRTGNFTFYASQFHDTIMIERTDSLQVERNLRSGFITKSKVNWLSDCDFELIFMNSSDPKIESIADQIKKTPLKIHIIKVEKDYYAFELKMEGITKTRVDTTWFQNK